MIKSSKKRFEASTRRITRSQTKEKPGKITKKKDKKPS